MTVVDYDDLTTEQQQAVDELDRNVTLTAGAGTGKTTTLTARYLRMFEAAFAEHSAGEDPNAAPIAEDPPLLPENIVTTTFTERAATELEESIREEITRRLSDLDPEGFRAWRAVADGLEDGYIHTLHGFCARLLREHALTIDGLDPGFEPIDEDETTALLAETVSAVLEEYETHEATRTLARQFSRSQLQDVLMDLLGERPDSLEWAKDMADIDEDEYLEFVEATLHPIDREEATDRLSHPRFVEAVETLREFVEEPPAISTDGKTWGRAEGVIEVLEPGYDDGVPSRRKQTLIAELSQHLTTSNGERYAGYTGAKTHWDGHPRKAAFDEAFETLVETLQPEEYAVDVDPALERRSVPFVRALADLTQLAAEAYADRKDRRNVLDFADLIAETVAFLEADANEHVREELRERFHYVMVDEFQDTDPRQWDLIKLLTAEDPEDFDARNVFVVGDAKQSIYRFRNADVALFEEAADRLEAVADDARREPAGEADDADQLSTNFRTLPVVLETINELFDAVFDADPEPYEAAPQALTADRDDPADLGHVEYLAVPTDEEVRADRFEDYAAFATAGVEHDTELEAMALAARLSQLLAEPVQVYPEADEGERDERLGTADPSEGHGDDAEETPPEPRDIEPSDIAILIRSRTHLKKYERALTEADVPYSVASGIGFYEAPEITALLNCFRALADPGDERALYGVLRSPMFGHTDDTLAELKLHDEPLWAALQASDHDELRRTYELLSEWRALAGVGEDATAGLEGSWAAFLTRIIEDTGYLVSISADERPEQARANVEKFREYLRGLGDEGVRSLTTLVTRIERRLELGGRESEADTTDEGVQILTIHDAKGMEFPVVVVPGIDRGFNDRAAIADGQVEFEQVGDRHAVGLKAPSPDDPFDMQDTIARETLRERRRAEEHAEEKRTLYVACTRARDRLLLSGCHDVDSDAETPTVSEFEEADPDDPSGWRDWVQPELLPEEILAQLDEHDRVRREYGDGAYTVSLPSPPADRPTPTPDTEPAVALSPTPEPPAPSFRLSATDYASLCSGYGELVLDEASQTYYVEAVDADSSSPDERHAEDTASIGTDADTAGEPTDGPAVDRIKPRVFGELVHRLCELRPPEARWPSVMEQTLVDEDAAVELTDELTARVRKHTRRGIEYVDEQAAALSVDQQYDELYVTAEFETGEITGYIDHLIMAEEAYHIIDYKTGEMTPDELEADAAYYANQMKPYAVALTQQGAARPVRVSLVFTDIDDAWSTEWSPTELAALETEIRNTIHSRQ